MLAETIFLTLCWNLYLLCQADLATHVMSRAEQPCGHSLDFSVAIKNSLVKQLACDRLPSRIIPLGPSMSDSHVFCATEAVKWLRLARCDLRAFCTGGHGSSVGPQHTNFLCDQSATANLGFVSYLTGKCLYLTSKSPGLSLCDYYCGRITAQ